MLWWQYRESEFIYELSFEFFFRLLCIKQNILAKTTIWIIPWRIAFFSSFFYVKRTCNLYWLKYYFCLRLEVNAAEIAKQFSSTFSTDSRRGSTWGIIFFIQFSLMYFFCYGQNYICYLFFFFWVGFSSQLYFDRSLDRLFPQYP